MMGQLKRELRDEGFERTERESPFHEDGELWKNQHEVVCDETGIVLDDSGPPESTVAELSSDVPTYEHSGRAILPGANYGNSFFYESKDS